VAPDITTFYYNAKPEGRTNVRSGVVLHHAHRGKRNSKVPILQTMCITVKSTFPFLLSNDTLKSICKILASSLGCWTGLPCKWLKQCVLSKQMWNAVLLQYVHL